MIPINFMDAKVCEETDAVVLQFQFNETDTRDKSLSKIKTKSKGKVYKEKIDIKIFERSFFLPVKK